MLSFSCSDLANKFDESKIAGRYSIQFESDLKEQNSGSFLADVFGRVLNASNIETTFDGKGNAINHFGNSILGVGAKLLGADIDEDNIMEYKFKYKVEGKVIMVKYHNDTEFKPWAKVMSYNEDYSYLRLYPLFDNPENENMQLVKKSDKIEMKR